MVIFDDCSCMSNADTHAHPCPADFRTRVNLSCTNVSWTGLWAFFSNYWKHNGVEALTRHGHALWTGPRRSQYCAVGDPAHSHRSLQMPTRLIVRACKADGDKPKFSFAAILASLRMIMLTATAVPVDEPLNYKRLCHFFAHLQGSTAATGERLEPDDSQLIRRRC